MLPRSFTGQSKILGITPETSSWTCTQKLQTTVSDIRYSTVTKYMDLKTTVSDIRYSTVTKYMDLKTTVLDIRYSIVTKYMDLKTKECPTSATA